MAADVPKSQPYTITLNGSVIGGTFENDKKISDDEIKSLEAAGILKSGTKLTLSISDGDDEIKALTKWISDNKGFTASANGTSITVMSNPQTMLNAINEASLKSLATQSGIKLDDPTKLAKVCAALWIQVGGDATQVNKFLEGLGKDVDNSRREKFREYVNGFLGGFSIRGPNHDDAIKGFAALMGVNPPVMISKDFCDSIYKFVVEGLKTAKGRDDIEKLANVMRDFWETMRVNGGGDRGGIDTPHSRRLLKRL